MTRYIEGFSHFVTSMTAPVAFGWSDRRVGLAPTGKAPPYHGAHPERTLVDVAARPANYADLLRQTGCGKEATTIAARTETIRAKHTEQNP